MKRNIFLLTVILLIVILLPAGSLVTNENVNKSRYANDHLIVKLKNDLSQLASSDTRNGASEITAVKDISLRLNIQPLKIKKLFPTDLNNNCDLSRKYELDRFFVVYVKTNKDIAELCKDYERNPNVDFAEPDFIGESAGKKGLNPVKPNDEYFNRQWGLYNDGTVRTTTGKRGKQGADMNVLKGWEVETGGENIIIAILDSGTKLDHPDLKGRIWVNKNEKRDGRDNDGNGFVDDIYGYNFAYDDDDVRDDGGHGTNICGTVGAVPNNRIGYAGIDQNCTLMICKNLDDENLGEYTWWATSLYYAANNGAMIINMSEGGYDYSKTLNTAVNYAYDAGCLILASMMNKNNGDNYYPAAYKNVIAVGATDTDDGRCRQFTWGGGSNWGDHIAVVAPGNRIYGLDYRDNNNYDVYWSGTSQATAYVSGIAALLLSQDFSLTNKELREIITSTAVDQIGDPREDKPGWDKYYGFGRVDLYAALMYGKMPVEKREVKDKNNGAYNDGQNNNKQDYYENNDQTNDTEAKAVESKSSDKKSKQKEGKRARKVEY